MKTITNIIKSLVLASVVFMFSGSLQAAELKKVEANIATPALKLESLNGEILDLKNETGKVVLVQFWATYCTPCRVEMPSMNKLIKRLKAEKVPFKIIAVNNMFGFHIEVLSIISAVIRLGKIYREKSL